MQVERKIFTQPVKGKSALFIPTTNPLTFKTTRSVNFFGRFDSADWVSWNLEKKIITFIQLIIEWEHKVFHQSSNREAVNTNIELWSSPNVMERSITLKWRRFMLHNIKTMSFYITNSTLFFLSCLAFFISFWTTVALPSIWFSLQTNLAVLIKEVKKVKNYFFFTKK